MLGTGIMALANYLRLPEIYESYGDTNVDRLTNPLLYKDAGRVPVNAFLDAIEPSNIIEISRTGVTGISRGKKLI